MQEVVSKRFKMTIAYDGRFFSGWQVQPNKQTIQGTLEQAIVDVCSVPTLVRGSGRTDAGVHAEGQVAHFDAPEGSRMKSENWLAALNQKLPSSIRILKIIEVDGDFHARFSAVSKTYRYDLYLGSVLSPFKSNLVWHFKKELNVEKLKELSQLFVGEHNFKNFAALRGNETEETSYVRRIDSVSVEEEGALICLRFQGNGFLYKMVRLMVGGMVKEAAGQIPEGTVKEKLTLVDFEQSKLFCAPPDGLYLEEVVY